MCNNLESITSKNLTELAVLNREALFEQWVLTFGCTTPRHVQATLLRSALSWHCQIKQHAGAGSGKADRMIRSLQRTVTSKVPDQSLAYGTRLLREWQGQTHHVTVLSQGFEYNGKMYRSLTAIARMITGTAWSGPLFFGLRK